MNQKNIPIARCISALIACGALALFASPAAAVQPEELLGTSLNAERKEITIDVVSSGCTQRSDFRFEMKENVLTVLRAGRDACKAMPRKTSFTYALKEAGVDPNKPFRFGNRFIANEHTANMQKKTDGK